MFAALCLVAVPASAQTESDAQPPPESESAAAEAGDETDGAEAADAEATSEPMRPAVEDTDQAIRLRGLEERVNELKEQVFRSKARLLILRETVLNGVISGARARIMHVNDVGSAFNLTRLDYSLDGSPLFSKAATDGSLDNQREIELFNGSIVPGNHNLSVMMHFQGSGYGVFSYLRAYKFRIPSSFAFTAEEGRMTTVKVVAYEKGGFTTDVTERLAVRYDVKVKQDAQAAETTDSAVDANQTKAPGSTQP